jgi:glycosyltransferase involved in cell wall biosynthesis
MATLSATRLIVDASCVCFTRAREYQICRVDVKSTRFERQPRQARLDRPAAINRRHTICPSRTDGRPNPPTPTQFLNPTRSLRTSVLRRRRILARLDQSRALAGVSVNEDPHLLLLLSAQWRGRRPRPLVGDFWSADLDWVRSQGLSSKLELIPFVLGRRALELQRDSDLLVLLLPEVGERGHDVPSSKLDEYLAARRPILAPAPPNGTAAELIREANAGIIVAPDDLAGLREAIDEFLQRRRRQGLPDLDLSPAFRPRISRVERVRELAELLWQVRQHPG